MAVNLWRFVKKACTIAGFFIFGLEKKSFKQI